MVKNAKAVQNPGTSPLFSGQRLKDYDWRKDSLRERLAEEREYLRVRLLGRFNFMVINV